MGYNKAETNYEVKLEIHSPASKWKGEQIVYRKANANEQPLNWDLFPDVFYAYLCKVVQEIHSTLCICDW